MDGFFYVSVYLTNNSSPPVVTVLDTGNREMKAVPKELMVWRGLGARKTQPGVGAKPGGMLRKGPPREVKDE